MQPVKSRELPAPDQTPVEFPGPKEHGPTEAPSLSDGTAFAKALLDETFDAPLGRVFELLFGDDNAFMKDFLSNNQKVLDVQITPFADKNGKSTRAETYVKPLSGPIGPKQTRCICEDIIEVKDFDTAVQVIQSTTSPDVPSGDAFVIKTRFSLMWGPRNTTRLVTNCVIEWSKSSWIKGAIEKGATSGQVQFMSDLSNAIKSTLQDGGKRRKSRSRRAISDTRVEDTGEEKTTTSTQAPQGIVVSALSIVSNININVLILVMLIGVVLAILRIQGTIKSEIAERHRLYNMQHEKLWQHEEAELWNWLSERTFGYEYDAIGEQPSQRRHVDEVSDAMGKLQLQEALAQAREHLAVLEEAADMHDVD
ncbi:hypothetical protein MRB53_039312 [Persea americana]|nr:hypothetical protein MRB53_039312 [Persea americana]